MSEVVSAVSKMKAQVNSYKIADIATNARGGG